MIVLSYWRPISYYCFSVFRAIHHFESSWIVIYLNCNGYCFPCMVPVPLHLWRHSSLFCHFFFHWTTLTFTIYIYSSLIFHLNIWTEHMLWAATYFLFTIKFWCTFVKQLKQSTAQLCNPRDSGRCSWLSPRNETLPFHLCVSLSCYSLLMVQLWHRGKPSLLFLSIMNTVSLIISLSSRHVPHCVRPHVPSA